MPITCKCGEVHEAVPQTEFDKRVKTLTEQRTQLKAELDDAQSKFSPKEHEALLADRQALVQLRQQLESRDALEGAGFKTDAKAQRVSRMLYEMAVEGVEEGKRVSFADWLKDSKGAGAEPTLAPLRVTQAAQDQGKGKAGPPTKTGDKARSLPDTNRGAADPAGGRMTQAQFLEVMNRTPLAERAAKAKELGFDSSGSGRPGASSSAENDANSENAAA